MNKLFLSVSVWGAFALIGAGQNTPPEVHPAPGTSLEAPGISVTFMGRKQNYDKGVDGLDGDVHSPKSVNILPSGEKYYVNCLEGCATLVFDCGTGEKLKTISHRIDTTMASLWAPESGLFPFKHVYKQPNVFGGKPVEGAFSHGGKYLWVPYYRRTFDINAQEPSALAVIDTEKDTIIRLFETGPLPKMVACSNGGGLMAVSHWGDNTVGLLDISSEDPLDWHYTACLVVDYKLKLDLSTKVPVNRDLNSGYCLRGTVFTPDDRYLLVGCMGGGGGIAVIDIEKGEYLGRIMGARPNLRHLLIHDGIIYASINSSGYVQSIPLEKFMGAVAALGKGRTARLDGWTSCKVPAGARTIVISPDGKYIFAACNFSSKVAVVDAAKMVCLGSLQADSYPVGMDISDDGTTLLVTSQARQGRGGNCVGTYSIRRRMGL